MVGAFGFDHDVINVGLNGPPDEVPEAFEHAALVFFRPNSIET